MEPALVHDTRRLALPIAFGLAALALFALPAAARAEEMLVKIQDGLMCRDEKSLADFTANDGTLKPSVMAVPFSDTSKRF